jgi:Flp pilus assembly protein TadB
MEVVPQNGISWAEYYLVVGLVGVVATVAAALGFLPNGSGSVVAVLLFGVLVVSSAYHLYRRDDSLLERLRE